jgi:hypothetical protein
MARRFVIACFLAGMIATHIFFLWRVRDRIARADPDFTVFYTAARILRQGRGSDLYAPRTQQLVQQQFAHDSDIRRGPLPYIHPPFEALVFLPLTFLPYESAFWLWNAANLGILFAIALLLRQSLLSLRRFSAWTLALASLAFFPIFANFHQGQDAILLLLLVVLGFRALDREKDFAAGCWLGLAVFKYHLIVPLVLILAVWKIRDAKAGQKRTGRSFIFGFFTLASAAVLVSLAITGWRGAMQYPSYVWHIVSVPGFGNIPFRQLPNIVGLLAGWPHLETLGWPVQIIVLICSAGVWISVARLRAVVNSKASANLAIACAVVAALLVGYNTNTYDLSLLIVPLAIAADDVDRKSQSGDSRRRLLWPTLPLLFSPLWFYLWLRWERINLIAIFLLWWLFELRREILRSNEPA